MPISAPVIERVEPVSIAPDPNAYFEALTQHPAHYASTSLRTMDEVLTYRSAGSSPPTQWVIDPALDAARVDVEPDQGAWPNEDNLFLEGPFHYTQLPQDGQTFSLIWDYRWSAGMHAALTDYPAHRDGTIHPSWQDAANSAKQFAWLAADDEMGASFTFLKLGHGIKGGVHASPGRVGIRNGQWDTQLAGANVTRADTAQPHNNDVANPLAWELEATWYRMVIHFTMRGDAAPDNRDHTFSIWRIPEGGAPFLMWDAVQYRCPWHAGLGLSFRGLRVIYSPKLTPPTGIPPWSYAMRNVLCLVDYGDPTSLLQAPVS